MVRHRPPGARSSHEHTSSGTWNTAGATNLLAQADTGRVTGGYGSGPYDRRRRR